MSRKKEERRKKEREKMPFIVATYVSASSQGQRTHSARTKIRSRVINVKMNMKGIYDNYECEVCLMEDESQKHVYECKEIWKRKESNEENIPK